MEPHIAATLTMTFKITWTIFNCHKECPFLILSQSNYLIQIVDKKFTYLMANSADPDQLASSEANWCGSTLFANAGYIRVQQDKG